MTCTKCHGSGYTAPTEDFCKCPAGEVAREGGAGERDAPPITGNFEEILQGIAAAVAAKNSKS